MFERIVCPIDFSESSVRTLLWAEFFAKSHKSQLVFLHIVSPSKSPVFIVDFNRKRAEAVVKLREFLLPLSIPYEQRISAGNPAQEIIEFAENSCATMILMGSRGLTGLSHRLHGSTTEIVIRKTGIPVMTITPHCILPDVKKNRRILIPVSSPQRLNRRQALLAVLIAKLGPRATLLHVIEPGKLMSGPESQFVPRATVSEISEQRMHKRLQTIANRISFFDKNVDANVSLGKSADEILNKLTENTYDCVLLGVRKRRLFSNFANSVAYTVIVESPVPVITIKGSF